MILKTHDEPLKWRPAHSQRYSECRVQLFEMLDDRGRGQHKPILILTEARAVAGQTIGNSIELLIQMLLLQHGLRSAQQVQIYTHRFIENQPDAWDEVKFNRFDQDRAMLPTWQPTNWKAIAQKIEAVGQEWSAV